MRIQSPITTPNTTDKNINGKDDDATADAQKVHVRGWDPEKKEGIRGGKVSALAHELKDQAEISNRGRQISELAGRREERDSGRGEFAASQPSETTGKSGRARHDIAMNAIRNMRA